LGVCALMAASTFEPIVAWRCEGQQQNACGQR
jgi:hypothetical protein